MDKLVSLLCVGEEEVERRMERDSLTRRRWELTDIWIKKLLGVRFQMSIQRR